MRKVQIGLEAPARFWINNNDNQRAITCHISAAPLYHDLILLPSFLLLSCRPGLLSRSLSINLQSMSLYFYFFCLPTLKYSSSCWVIIQNKVYDVTEFLPVKSFIAHFSPSCFSHPYIRNIQAAQKLFLNTLDVMRRPFMSPFTLQTHLRRTYHCLNTWVH